MDDTARLQELIDAGQPIPPGTYRLSRPLRIVEPRVFRGCTFTGGTDGVLLDLGDTAGSCVFPGCAFEPG